MNKDQLLKRLTAIVEDFERGRLWGTIEIQFGDGVANLIRKTTNEKVGSYGKGDTRERVETRSTFNR